MRIENAFIAVSANERGKMNTTLSKTTYVQRWFLSEAPILLVLTYGNALSSPLKRQVEHSTLNPSAHRGPFLRPFLCPVPALHLHNAFYLFRLVFCNLDEILYLSISTWSAMWPFWTKWSAIVGLPARVFLNTKPSLYPILSTHTISYTLESFSTYSL